VKPDETEAAHLVWAGALDSLGAHRNRGAVLWEMAARKKASSPGTRSLFSPGVGAIPDLPPEDPLERMRREYFVLGFLCGRHPITLFRPVLPQRGLVKAKELYQHLDRPVETAAWLVTGKTVLTKKGDPMEFLTFEDETGIMETTFFPKVYHQCCHILETNRPYLLKGIPQSDWGAVTLTVSRARRIRPLGCG
jgi:DNA polymerase-3 subunit alpha/error-prone DNA polymerase